MQSLDLYVELTQNGYRVRISAEEREQAGPIDVRLPSDDKYQEARQAFLNGRADAGQARMLGQKLFDSFFQGGARDLFSRYYPPPGTGTVRLYIHLRPERDYCDLFSTPWELLWYQNDFVCLNSQFSIIRFIDLEYSSAPLSVSPPLHLALCGASPSGYPPINAQEEFRGIRESLNGARIDVRIFEHLTEGKLRDLLNWSHIMHFAGHGKVERGRGYLILEGDDGAYFMSGDMLGQLCRGKPLRLGVINACYGAREGSGGYVGILEGVAPALVKAGVPAVVAMQMPIHNDQAVKFATEFYRTLLGKEQVPVDRAIAMARAAIITSIGEEWRANPQWAAPVLYLRDRRGILFDLGFKSLLARYSQFQTEKYMRKLIAELNCDLDHPIPFSSLEYPWLPSLIKKLEQQGRSDLLQPAIERVLEPGTCPPSLQVPSPSPSPQVPPPSPSPQVPPPSSSPQVPPSSPSPTVPWPSDFARKLEDLISESFTSKDQIRLLLRHLEVEYDDLEGETRLVKIVSLVRRYVKELKKPHLLLDAIEQERPGLLGECGLR